MVKKDYTRIVILCEDRQQELFARYFLETYLNIRHSRRINVVPYNAGEGAGEQFVREKYLQYVQTYHKLQHHLEIALVVVMDADLLTTFQRQIQLDEVLITADEKRNDKDRIAIFVPRRNIETWINFLQDKSVDEDTAYPHLKRESDCKTEVIQLAQNCKNGIALAENAPSSLQEACEELKRLPRFDE